MPRRIYIQGLSELVFPKKCLICEEPGSNICAHCINTIAPAPISLEVDGVQVKAGALYSDSTAALVVLAKEENSSDARNMLVELLYIALQAAISDFDFAEYLLIPMPSSKKSNRRRGYKHSLSLTKSLLKRLLRDETNDKKFYIGDLIDINRKKWKEGVRTEHEVSTNQ